MADFGIFISGVSTGLIISGIYLAYLEWKEARRKTGS